MNIAIITTLNDNLIKAKLAPLVNLNQLKEIYFITDSVGPTFLKVQYYIPSKLLYKIGFHKSFAKFLLLFYICLRKNPEIIMSYNILPHGYSAFIIGKVLRKKVFQHLIGGFCDIKTEYQNSDNSMVMQFPILAKFFTQLNKFIVKNSDLIFVPGQSTQLILINELHILESKIVILHSSIDTNYFKPQKSDIVYDIVVVSALEIRKRIDLLLKVISIVKKTIPSVNVIILGRGSLKSNLVKLADELGVRENVQFLNFQPDVQKFYWKSKIFVLTSSFEGLSCSAMEAMATGLPVVVPNVGDMKEIAKNDETGFLIEHINNPNSYAEKIIQLLNDDELRRRCSSNATELIGNYHSTRSAEAKWRVIFAKLGY